MPAGAAIALGLARNGADVIIADIAQQDSSARLVAQILELGRNALAVTCDVRHRATVDAAVQEAADRLGAGPDVLVTSAGDGQPT